MENWRPQVYRSQAPANVDPVVLSNAVATAALTTSVSPELPPIFSLRHLAHYTKTNYAVLRSISSRAIIDPYRTFGIRKRPLDISKPRFRRICVPEPSLLIVQRWINQHVLSKGTAHSASTAFAAGSSIKKAAGRHCCARWLIRIDAANFFESISEIRVFRVFLGLGYQPLVAFELARLCTRVGSQTLRRQRSQWQAKSTEGVIKAYRFKRVGHLPQGAPTSPVLANLSMYDFDQKVTNVAQQMGLEYSRYADDIILSTERAEFDRDQAVSVIGKIYSLMGELGLSPNVAKTRISPPGSRKIVLGLLVDGPVPRLTREFRHNLRRHLHYLLNPTVGPALHADARSFVAIGGLKNHVNGLIAFAHDIDPIFATECAEQFDKIAWPI